MDLRDTPEQAAFRREVRTWLERNLPEGWREGKVREPEDAAERVAFLKRWQRKLFEGGWAGLNWPKEYGGRAIGTIEYLIWAEEYTRLEAPNMINLSVGTALVGTCLGYKLIGVSTCPVKAQRAGAG